MRTVRDALHPCHCIPGHAGTSPLGRPRQRKRRGRDRHCGRRDGNSRGCGMSGPLARLGASMKIAVIGTGNIGGTLGQRWIAAGHDVVYGSRAATGEGPGGAPQRSVGDALAGAEVVLLAVPGRAIADVVAANGAALDGKVVIDAGNRIGEPETDSRSAIAAAAPQARYVRAFNTLGWRPLLSRSRGPRCSSPPIPARDQPPRNSSPRWAWSRSSPATPPPRPARSTPCCPCGSRWSSTTAGIGGSRFRSSASGRPRLPAQPGFGPVPVQPLRRVQGGDHEPDGFLGVPGQLEAVGRRSAPGRAELLRGRHHGAGQEGEFRGVPGIQRPGRSPGRSAQAGDLIAVDTRSRDRRSARHPSAGRTARFR
jgi:hypothetical protein